VKNVCDIERGRAFVGVRIKRIPGAKSAGSAGAAGNAAGHGAGVIQAFGKRVTGLKAQAHSRGALADAGLQSVIAGMRTGSHDSFGAEATDGVACGIELGIGRKGRVRASVTVRREDTGEMNSRGANVGGAQFDAFRFMVHAEGVRADISISGNVDRS